MEPRPTGRQPRRKRPLVRTDDEATAADAAMVADYRAGLTVQSVARKHRRRTAAVTAALNAADVPRLARRAEFADARRGVRHPLRWRPSKISTNLSDVTWAYIAGIFDGEGTLGCQRSTPLTWRVAINQLTHTGLCQWLLETIGSGTCTPVKNLPPNRRPMSVWRIHAQADVLDFATEVQPFLIVKREVTARALADLRPHFEPED